MDVGSRFGLTVSTTKTKCMVTGTHTTAADLAPIASCNMEIQHVSSFRYLDSHRHSDGRWHNDFHTRIAQASKVFGVLKKPIVQDPILTLSIKRSVFDACVMTTLLYESEC